MPDKVLDEVKGTGGKILKTSLSHDDEAKLQAALSAAKKQESEYGIQISLSDGSEHVERNDLPTAPKTRSPWTVAKTLANRRPGWFHIWICPDAV
jgi:hypothetical protein